MNVVFTAWDSSGGASSYAGRGGRTVRRNVHILGIWTVWLLCAFCNGEWVRRSLRISTHIPASGTCTASLLEWKRNYVLGESHGDRISILCEFHPRRINFKISPVPAGNTPRTRVWLYCICLTVFTKRAPNTSGAPTLTDRALCKYGGGFGQTLDVKCKLGNSSSSCRKKTKIGKKEKQQRIKDHAPSAWHTFIRRKGFWLLCNS